MQAQHKSAGKAQYDINKISRLKKALPCLLPEALCIPGPFYHEAPAATPSVQARKQGGNMGIMEKIMEIIIMENQIKKRMENDMETTTL